MVSTIYITPEIMILFLVIAVWSSIWKAIALWKAGKNNQVVWFIVLFIFNTIGLLEIIYLAFFRKDRHVKVIRVKENLVEMPYKDYKKKAVKKKKK